MKQARKLAWCLLMVGLVFSLALYGCNGDNGGGGGVGDGVM